MSATSQLSPREDQATPNQVHRYQQKVGFVNHVAVTTRPDIAKPISKLAEFLLNLSDKHDCLVDRLMENFWSTRYLAIQFNGNISADMVKINHCSIPRELRIASDAAFSDDPETRKSSQGMSSCYSADPSVGKPASRLPSRPPPQKQSSWPSQARPKKP